jgi:hypothetical protein
MTQQAAQAPARKEQIILAIKQRVAESPKCLEPLGVAADHATVERVQVWYIEGPRANLVTFFGRGSALVKFMLPGAESGLDFEFYHQFVFEYGGHLEGDEVSIDYAVIRDEDYFENSEPPAALSEPEIDTQVFAGG